MNLTAGIKGFQHAHGGLEVDQLGGLPRRHFLVHAPFLDVPVLVDVCGGPGLVGIDHDPQQRQRDERRARDGRDNVQRRDRPGVLRQRATGRRYRSVRLTDMDDAFAARFGLRLAQIRAMTQQFCSRVARRRSRRSSPVG